jgi:hypothetical protein
MKDMLKTNIKAGRQCTDSHTHMEGLRGLLEKYPTFGREKETGLLGALDT